MSINWGRFIYLQVKDILYGFLHLLMSSAISYWYYSLFLTFILDSKISMWISCYYVFTFCTFLGNLVRFSPWIIFDLKIMLSFN
jgi:hypothetical protein